MKSLVTVAIGGMILLTSLSVLARADSSQTGPNSADQEVRDAANEFSAAMEAAEATENDKLEVRVADEAKGNDEAKGDDQSIELPALNPQDATGDEVADRDSAEDTQPTKEGFKKRLLGALRKIGRAGKRVGGFALNHGGYFMLEWSANLTNGAFDVLKFPYDFAPVFTRTLITAQDDESKATKHTKIVGAAIAGSKVAAGVGTVIGIASRAGVAVLLIPVLGKVIVGGFCISPFMHRPRFEKKPGSIDPVLDANGKKVFADKGNRLFWTCHRIAGTEGDGVEGDEVDARETEGMDGAFQNAARTSGRKSGAFIGRNMRKVGGGIKSRWNKIFHRHPKDDTTPPLPPKP